VPKSMYSLLFKLERLTR